MKQKFCIFVNYRLPEYQDLIRRGVPVNSMINYLVNNNKYVLDIVNLYPSTFVVFLTDFSEQEKTKALSKAFLNGLSANTCNYSFVESSWSCDFPPDIVFVDQPSSILDEKNE